MLCPFCAGAPIVSLTLTGHSVSCTCSVGIFITRSTIEEAIAVWDQRPLSVEMRDAIEDVRVYIQEDGCNPDEEIWAGLAREWYDVSIEEVKIEVNKLGILLP